ncbi:unnamed protein product, partial [Adineta steineri]
MPVSSGFGYYPHNYPTTKVDRSTPTTQLISRTPKFQSLKQNGINTNSKSTSTGKLPSLLLSTRTPADKRPSLRSQTFVSMTKPNDTKLKVRKDNLVKTSSQRLPTVETPVRSISTSLEKKGAQILYS